MIMDIHSVKVLCRDKMKGTWKVVTGLLVFWLVALLYMSATLYNTSDINERTEHQLAKALQELDMLRKQNEELAQVAESLKDINSILGNKGKENNDALHGKMNVANTKLGMMKELGDVRKAADQSELNLKADAVSPSRQHEHLRRKIDNGVRESWYYVRSQLQQIKVDVSTDAAQRIDYILDGVADHERTLLNDLYNMSLSSGHGAWRIQEAQELSDLVQSRLHHLQNPKDCASAKKLVCNLNKGCGYGCQLHHVAYCFIVAYATQRTFVLDSRGWRYSPNLGWEKFFQPLSETCVDRRGQEVKAWGPDEAIEHVQVVDLPIVDSMHPRPNFLPQAIPRDLAPRLLRLHGHPFVWWLGQFLKYLLRPSAELESAIQASTMKLHFQKPIVGVHVRRTDKVGTEASFHNIDEYMKHVEEYYEQLSKWQKVTQKRVYLATDEPNLLEETKKKFPDYEIISDNDSSLSASLSKRYSESSLKSIILDIHFLSMTDYLVCTFSSQVCRVAYEIMQSLHPDASANFKSLDDIYYFGGQQGHNQMAVEPHHSLEKDEISLKVGDHLGIAGNHWDGFSKGKNHRSNRMGLYPSYKVEDDVRIADFPTYPEAVLQKDKNR